MRIYTSYYAAHKVFNPNLAYIKISTGSPSWFDFVDGELEELFPGWDLVNAYKTGLINNLEYQVIYEDRLKKLNKEEIISKIENMCKQLDKRDVVLLCYERPNEFCHRRFVGKWLGIDEFNQTEYEAYILEQFDK